MTPSRYQAVLVEIGKLLSGYFGNDGRTIDRKSGQRHVKKSNFYGFQNFTKFSDFPFNNPEGVLNAA